MHRSPSVASRPKQPKRGGEVRPLLGNHEILALGKRIFDDSSVAPPSDSPGRRRSFHRSWSINEGQAQDQAGLTPDHVQWLRSLPAMATDGDLLLMHSDTTAYLDWGASVSEVNENVTRQLAGEDLDEWWDLWSRLTTRHSYFGDGGVEAARSMLSAFGGRRIIHGHSIISDVLDTDPRTTKEPLEYAGDLVTDIDGGICDGGPCLLTRLR